MLSESQFNGVVKAAIPFLVALLSACASLAVPTAEIKRLADDIRPTIVAERRDFHMHPELSNREVRTEQVIAEKLRSLGLTDIRTHVAHHGVVALLKGGKPGPVVAYRADIDALPINEVHNVPYKSGVSNVMHACGHDAHTAIGLGVAEVLSQMRAELAGTVKFIFQPAEEGAPTGEEGGATLMIKEGALENPKPLAIFGMHTTTEIAAGKIGVRSGPAQAAANMFDLTIRGKMSHAAHPENGVDSIVVASECVTALQTIKSRRIDTFEPVILTIGTIHGGNRRNIISPEVKMEGTIRTFTDAALASVKKQMHQTLKGICDAYGASYQLSIDEATVPVYNDPALVSETVPMLRTAIGSSNVVDAELRMGAEDFSYFQRVVPGFYWRLGSGNKAKGITAEAHTPDFDIDEDCLVVGVKSMANVLWDYLERHNAK
jgi:amidohydrolase